MKSLAGQNQAELATLPALQRLLNRSRSEKLVYRIAVYGSSLPADRVHEHDNLCAGPDKRLLIRAEMGETMAQSSPNRGEFPQFFDTHAHLITNDYTAYPLSFAGQPGVGGKSRISREELEERLSDSPPSLENLSKWFAMQGVSAACGVQYKTAYSFDNSYLLDCAAKSPHLILPVVVANLEDAATPATISDLARDHGIVGVRATGLRNPQSGHFEWLDSDAARSSLDVIEALGLTLVLMSLPPRGGKPGEVEEMLELIASIAAARPTLKIVLDHVGWPALEGAPDFGLSPAHHALSHHTNVLFKFTTKSIVELRGAGVAPADALHHFVSVFGADRMMWGSDVGNQPIDYPTMISLAVEAGAKLTPDERTRVFSDTGRNVFGVSSVIQGRVANHG